MYILLKDGVEFKGRYGNYESAFVFAYERGWRDSTFDTQTGILTHVLKQGYEIKEVKDAD
jgi:hypothetical protein